MSALFVAHIVMDSTNLLGSVFCGGVDACQYVTFVVIDCLLAQIEYLVRFTKKLASC